ncbi:hypothetical protein NQ317_015493 [Molorchus minor]|uniref:CCHC-type domain-containing protein n=1 Tax=Molorchus minor TaxID=1323400 RepID=A0ABQ9JIC7_9CUCU|nr:hypothetical protein NQ317_015493 [Molorchus minor]
MPETQVGYIGHLQEFDPANSDWSVFKRRIDNYFVANNITDDKRKGAILLNVLNEEAYKLLYNLCLPEDPERKKYSELIPLLSEYFKPMEKAEKEEAVGRETGLDKTRFDVRDLRPYFRGNQTVTIQLFKERAEDLQRKGGIRIGLNRCKVVGRVEVLQCYKCWRYGHIRKKCTENTDMRTACSKCGKEAHAAKECTNKEYCQSCKAENHRMGTAKCPEFKAALSKARAEDAQRKSLND